MEVELLEKRLAYAYENFQTNELFFEPLTLRKKDFPSTSKRNKPVDDRITRPKTRCVKWNLTNGKELTISFLKNDVKWLTDIFQKYKKLLICIW